MSSRFTEFQLEKKDLSPIIGYLAYPVVSLEESLEDVSKQINNLSSLIQEIDRHCRCPPQHDLSRDEAGAIFLYTMESGKYSFYLTLNRVLRDENRKKVVPWFPYLKLLNNALQKLPTVKKCIWRGVAKDVSHDYHKGDLVTWWSISSCSLSVDVVKDFLSSEQDSTLFMIEAVNGKNISGYTLYPAEEEVILLMGTKLRVESNALHHGNLRLVHLVEITDHDEGKLSVAMGGLSVTPKPPAKNKFSEFCIFLYSFVADKWIDFIVHTF